MRKIRELLRLHYDLKLSQVQIARSCNIGQSTVFRYLKRFEESGLSWPLPADCHDRVLEELLFAKPVAGQIGDRAPIDFAELDRQLQTHRHLSLQLLWEEYRAANPNGYRYSYFCELHRKWKASKNVVLRQEHRAGEKLFVDWAGATVPLHDATSGDVCGRASLFVAALGASSYTFAFATSNQDLRNWIDCHVRAFEFFGGCPTLVIPDNPADSSKSCLPVRAGSEPHVSGDGPALQRGGHASPSSQTERQSQSGICSGRRGALDYSCASPSQILLCGGTQ